MSNDPVSKDAGSQSGQDRRARAAGIAGSALFAQGRFPEAVAQFEDAVRLLPSDVDLRYNLGSAWWAAGDLARARTNFLRCVERAPEFARAHDGLARLHHESNDTDAAFRHSSTAVRISPWEPEFLLTHAVVLESLGKHADSWDAAQPVLAFHPLADRAAILCTRLASKLGRRAETAALLDAALLQPPAEPKFRRQLHFAASAFLDLLGRYDQAFMHARLAHQILPPPYDPLARAREFERRIEHWTAERAAALPKATHGSGRPVFIVGMPRSGTSLVEQILGCHGQIHAAGEIDAMNRTARALDSLGVPYPTSVESLTSEQADRVAAVYLGIVDSIDSSARYVADKMPLNFMYLDLIAALLPQSRIIHCTRDPLDTCLSCYLTDFQIPYDFTSDLRNLGAFYGHYRKLMEHWKSVLPLRVLEVRYEDVVADVESQTRRMLNFLELPWNERCLRFHESARVVATASRDQVRLPIYGSSVGRWRNYEKHLGPLRAGLGT